MASDIEVLATSAERLREQMAKHISWIRICEMSVQRAGITSPPDVRRIGKQIHAKLVERGVIPVRRKKKQQSPKRIELVLTETTKEEIAASIFGKWIGRLRRETKQRGEKFELNPMRLTSYVYLFIESEYSQMQPAERPRVDVTESHIRSAWAKRAARTRARNLRIKYKKAQAITQTEPEQTELF